MSTDHDQDDERSNGTAASRDEAEGEDEIEEALALDVRTTTYQTETPRWLWHLFCTGPADDVDRFADRITGLIARDVIEHRRGDLNTAELQAALTILRDHDGL